VISLKGMPKSTPMIAKRPAPILCCCRRPNIGEPKHTTLDLGPDDDPLKITNLCTGIVK
jgi:hypothetical protein